MVCLQFHFPEKYTSFKSWSPLCSKTKRHKGTKGWRQPHISMWLQSDSPEKTLTQVLASMSGWRVFTSPFVQPCDFAWNSWNSWRGSRYRQWLGRLGVTVSCIIRMFRYKQWQNHCQKKKTFSSSENMYCSIFRLLGTHHECSLGHYKRSLGFMGGMKKLSG